MNVILWIIGILFVISIVTEIIKGIGEKIGYVVGFFVIIIFAIFAIRFLAKSMRWLVDRLHYLICLIPENVLYAYMALFLIILLVWLGICILNTSLIYAIEDVVYTLRYFGSFQEIKWEVKTELLQKHSGLMAAVIKSKRYERIFPSILNESSYKLKNGCCTYVVFEEFVDVLDGQGMATDKEMMQEIQSQQGYSPEVVEISRSLDDLHCCLDHMVMCRRAESRLLNQDEEEGEPEYYEPKLYQSTNPSPSPKNMLPTQIIEDID